MDKKVEALVLRSIDYREYDKILTLFSAHEGKLTASLKGVKKAGAKLKFASSPFCFAEYVLAQKEDRYTVTSASSIENFYALREDQYRRYGYDLIPEIRNKSMFIRIFCF
jgi:DNA repair protein RecO (recombination protein O)